MDFNTAANPSTRIATASSLKSKKKLFLVTDFVLVWITADNRTPVKTNSQQFI